MSVSHLGELGKQQVTHLGEASRTTALTTSGAASASRSWSPAAAVTTTLLTSGDPPQFKFCYDTKVPCAAPEDVKWVYPPVEHAGSRGKPPVVIQIGSAALRSTDPFVDLDLHRRALQKLPQDTVRFIFVDANAENEQSVLRMTARGLPVQSSQVSFVAGMISDTCATERFTMHQISPQAARDFGVAQDTIQLFQGPKVQGILNSIHGFAAQKSDPHWKAFSRAPNVTAYIVERVTRCISTEAFLAEVGVTPDRIAMFVCDAETADYIILDSFMRSPDFRPGYLQYELWSEWEAPVHMPLLRKLWARGYTLGRSFDTTDANNVFGYLP